MDLAAGEIAPLSVKIAENPAEMPTGEILPSMPAEIAAQTTSGRLGGAPEPNNQGPGVQDRSPAANRARHADPSRPARSSSQRWRGSAMTVSPLSGIPWTPWVACYLARTTVPITSEQIDRDIVVAFESGDLGRPIVLGVLRRTDGQEPFEPRAHRRRLSDLSSRPLSTASNWS